MADLDVQRKKSSPLPWIILMLVALALLAFFLIRNNDGELNTTAPVTTDSTVTEIDTTDR
jgi:lipopolysaccharide export system protein LptC